MATVNDVGVGAPKIFAVTGTAAIALDNGDAAATPNTEALRKLRRLKYENGLLIFVHTLLSELFHLCR